MGDLDLSGLDYSNFGGYSAFLADQVAEEQNRMQEELAAIGEYHARKDEALFQTAEASMKQKELLEQQLAEVKEQNIQLKENYRLLNELYESAKEDAKNSKKEAKANKIFGWVSFAVGTLIGIAGIVFGIIF